MKGVKEFISYFTLEKPKGKHISDSLWDVQDMLMVDKCRHAVVFLLFPKDNTQFHIDSFHKINCVACPFIGDYFLQF